MRMEECPSCKETFGHHAGSFIQCTHCGYVLASPLKARPPRNNPMSARERHAREDRVRFADRDYSGDPPELDFS